MSLGILILVHSKLWFWIYKCLLISQVHQEHTSGWSQGSTLLHYPCRRSCRCQHQRADAHHPVFRWRTTSYSRRIHGFHTYTVTRAQPAKHWQKRSRKSCRNSASISESGVVKGMMARATWQATSMAVQQSSTASTQMHSTSIVSHMHSICVSCHVPVFCQSLTCSLFWMKCASSFATRQNRRRNCPRSFRNSLTICWGIRGRPHDWSTYAQQDGQLDWKLWLRFKTSTSLSQRPLRTYQRTGPNGAVTPRTRQDLFWPPSQASHSLLPSPSRQVCWLTRTVWQSSFKEEPRTLERPMPK